jgi:uridine phosphorylase
MSHNKLPIYNLGDFIPYLNITINNNIIKQFSNIKYVILQGSAERTLHFANQLLLQLKNIDPIYCQVNNLFNGSSYVAYKVANALLVSHGMGNSSILTLLNTLKPLLHLCDNDNNIEYIRIGTSGGVGVEAGTVILTEHSYTADLINGYPIYQNNNKIIHPTTMSNKINQKIINSWQSQNHKFSLIEKNTMCADDFYLSQARMDGFINLDFNKIEQKNYLQKLKENNIGNIEMESGALGYFANLHNLLATTISTTIVNRIDTDQVTITSQLVKEYSLRGQIVISNYLIAN